uniref:Lon N-terminal domain-containing protein n=1 Tax=Timema bartmani TaxID=61472 RepID=A0A7R9F741_9NEOP|nr:unnamed protein product [Timema bartmani]
MLYYTLAEEIVNLVCTQWNGAHVELVRSCINEDYSNVIVGVCATQPNVLGEPHYARGEGEEELSNTGLKEETGRGRRGLTAIYAPPFAMTYDDNPEVQTLVESFREDVRRMVKLMDATVPPVAKLKRMLNTLPGAHLTDLTASVVMLSNADKLRILDTLDVAKRVNILCPLVSQYIKSSEITNYCLSQTSSITSSCVESQ